LLIGTAGNACVRPQAHGLGERQAVGLSLTLDSGEPSQGLIQAHGIDLDPLAANQGKTFRFSEQAFDFCLREGLAFKRHFHREVEQRIRSKRRRCN
jgi:hypothetical protein